MSPSPRVEHLVSYQPVLSSMSCTKYYAENEIFLSTFKEARIFRVFHNLEIKLLYSEYGVERQICIDPSKCLQVLG